MGRNKLISLVAAALLIASLFVDYANIWGFKGSLFDMMSITGGGILVYPIGIPVLLFAVMTFMGKPLLPRIMAFLLLLWTLYCVFVLGAAPGASVGMGVWLMLAGSLLGTLFSKKDA